MDSWNDDYTRDAMRGTAEMLTNVSNQLKIKLTPHDDARRGPVPFAPDHIVC
jgi:hypothetical protein